MVSKLVEDEDCGFDSEIDFSADPSTTHTLAATNEDVEVFRCVDHNIENFDPFKVDKIECGS